MIRQIRYLITRMQGNETFAKDIIRNNPGKNAQEKELLEKRIKDVTHARIWRKIANNPEIYTDIGNLTKSKSLGGIENDLIKEEETFIRQFAPHNQYLASGNIHLNFYNISELIKQNKIIVIQDSFTAQAEKWVNNNTDINRRVTEIAEKKNSKLRVIDIGKDTQKPNSETEID